MLIKSRLKINNSQGGMTRVQAGVHENVDMESNRGHVINAKKIRINPTCRTFPVSCLGGQRLMFPV